MLDFTDIAIIDTDVITPSDVARRAGSLRTSSDASAEAFADCGRAFMSFGLFQEAMAAYSDAIARDSNCLGGFLGRAQAGYALILAGRDMENSRRSSEVASDYRQALKITGGTSREAILGLGSALLAANKFAECANWIEEQLRDREVDKNHEGDLLYLLALCRLFAGDLDEACNHAAKMDRVAGFEGERFFICGLISWLKGDRGELIEYRAALQLRDEKLARALGAIEAGAEAGTFLELARLLI